MDNLEIEKQLNILKSRIDAKADAGAPIVLFSAISYLSMTNHVTWTKVDVSGLVPNNAVAILFQCTASGGTFFQLSARACGSSADPFIKIETDDDTFASGPVIIPIGPDVADSNKLKFEYQQGADGSWTYGVLGYIVGPLGGSGGGAGSVVVPTTFISLTDTFASYTGLALKHLRVNSGATGVEAGELITVSASAPSGGSNGDVWIQYDTTPSVGPHQLDSALYHTVSGLTPGTFLKALSATTFGFAAHGLGYGDVGAAPAFVSGTANYFWATPNGSAGVPSLRAIVAADIPALSYEASGAVSTHNALASAHGFTTAGKAIANLTNPGAVTFLRVNADNSAALLSDTNMRTALGLAIGTNVAPAFVSGAANYFWATPNGSTGVPSLRAIVAADIPALSYEASGAVSTHNALATAHGFTTVGKAIANLTNPGAITFLRVNADNSASLLSASDERTALGLAIGTNVQAYNANLGSLAGLSYAAAAFVKMTGANTFTLDTSVYLTSVTAHNVLSATHGDSTAAAVVRGDIIIGSGATPKWTRLALGAAGTYLAGSATEPAWATLNQAAVAGLTTTDSPIFATVKCSALTDGYIPYHVSDAAGLANGPLQTDGTSIGLGVSAVTRARMYIGGSATADANQYATGLLIFSANVAHAASDLLIGQYIIPSAMNAAGYNNVVAYGLKIYPGALANPGTGTAYYGIYVDSPTGAGTNIDIYAVGTISGGTLVDRTPFPKDTVEAWAAVKSMKAKAGGGVDHAALHPSIRHEFRAPKRDKNGKEVLVDEVGRNLSATVSALVAALQDAEARIKKIESTH